MKACIAALLLLFSNVCFSEPPGGRQQNPAAYPEPEAAAAWGALAAGYVRKAVEQKALNKDPLLNARVDAVMASVGTAVAALHPRFARSAWKAILIEDFGRGAAAFPGGILLVDARFVRALELTDDELALVFSHEAAHIVAGHASEKLSFMAGFVGKNKAPTARAALLEFLAQDSYAAVFQPTELLQEREADSIGAAILHASGYDPQRALRLFDKMADREERHGERAPDSHDPAAIRRQTVLEAIAELERRPRPGP